MSTHLSRYCQKRRVELDMKISDLARKFYKNVSKGIRRITNFEKTGEIHPDLLGKISSSLNIDEITLNELREKDQEEARKAHEEWLNTPITPCMLRCLKYACESIPIPDYIENLKQAKNYTSAYAKKHHERVALVWTRKIKVCYGVNGEIENHLNLKVIY